MVKMARKNSKTEGYESILDAPVLKEVEEELVSVHQVDSQGQSYIVYSTDPWNLFKIKKSKGGHLPKELSGAFTSAQLAERAIEIYENNKKA